MNIQANKKLMEYESIDSAADYKSNKKWLKVKIKQTQNNEQTKTKVRAKETYEFTALISLIEVLGFFFCCAGNTILISGMNRMDPMLYANKRALIEKEKNLSSNKLDFEMMEAQFVERIFFYEK